MSRRADRWRALATRAVSALSPPILRRLDPFAFWLVWGFRPPPPWADMTRYELLLAQLAVHDIAHVDGDIVEVGVFVGAGTYKLCRFFERRAPDKRVIAIDVFDPGRDLTAAADGRTMASRYADQLAGRDQRGLFDELTAGCHNLVVVSGDSADVDLPTRTVAFGYIDGNHDPAYIRSDFQLLWPRLSPGGLLAFDDYGRDLPGLTAELHTLIGEHAEEIERVWVTGYKTLLLRKAGDAPSLSRA